MAAQEDREHQEHHPAGATVPAPAAKLMSTKAGTDMAQMDAQMKTMREMHEKMMAAKTPEERNALMGEHMKTMQDGMAIMDEMHSCDMGKMKGNAAMRQKMMEKHMEMMHSMMQMMIDRLPTAPAK